MSTRSTCGGWQVAGIQALFARYLAFAGFRERTPITAYMVSFAMIVCVIVGSIVGIRAAAGPRRAKVVELILDTFQTFPSFICLIPAIMLGINQTIVYALCTVVIAAFIGTTNRGQEIFRSKADNNAGKSLVVGLCIAFPGLERAGDSGVRKNPVRARSP